MAWYQTFFDECYLKNWGSVLSQERTQKEIDFIVQTLDLPRKARILDLCCGQGRQVLELAKKGYQVVGLDFSKTLLRHAREQAKEQNLSVEFVRSDMRCIPFEDEFDAIVNLFTSFGYLEEDEEDEKVIKAVSKALKTEGRFLIDLSNHARLMRDLPNQNHPLIEEEYFDLLSGRLETRWTFEEDENRKERISSQRIYTFTELHKMLKSSSLRKKEVFGGFDGSDYKMDSKRMIVLAEKI